MEIICVSSLFSPSDPLLDAWGIGIQGDRHKLSDSLNPNFAYWPLIVPASLYTSVQVRADQRWEGYAAPELFNEWVSKRTNHYALIKIVAGAHPRLFATRPKVALPAFQFRKVIKAAWYYPDSIPSSQAYILAALVNDLALSPQMSSEKMFS